MNVAEHAGQLLDRRRDVLHTSDLAVERVWVPRDLRHRAAFGRFQISHD